MPYFPPHSLVIPIGVFNNITRLAQNTVSVYLTKFLFEFPTHMQVKGIRTSKVYLYVRTNFLIYLFSFKKRILNYSIVKNNISSYKWILKLINTDSMYIYGCFALYVATYDRNIKQRVLKFDELILILIWPLHLALIEIQCIPKLIAYCIRIINKPLNNYHSKISRYHCIIPFMSNCRY